MNPVKGIHIVIPQKEPPAKVTYYPAEYVPRQELDDPATVKDRATLMIHMCRSATEQGWEVCKKCKESCKWGKEYIKRMAKSYTPPKPEPKPVKLKFPVARGTGKIKWYGLWLRDELRTMGWTQRKLSEAIDYQLDTVNLACRGIRWSREFELLTMAALEISEDYARKSAAKWAEAMFGSDINAE